MILLILLFSTLSYADDFVATVTMFKGNALALKPGAAKPEPVTQGMRLASGTTVGVATKSFVRLVLKDNSTLNLGPESRVVLPQAAAGGTPLIELINGQLRAKVNKDVLQNAEGEAIDKLQIKTKRAAMGVRGTDFLAIYSNKTQITSLVTFEGRVAMAALEIRRPADVDVTNALQSNDVVFVTEGQLSTLTQQNPTPTEPVILSPTQFENLRSNETLATPTDTAGNAAKTLPPVPPLVDASAFMAPVDGTAAPNDNAGTGTEGGAPSGGLVNGSLIDLSSGVVIAPPPGSIPDPNTGILIPPASLLSASPSGQLQLAAGLEITTGGNIQVNPNAMATLAPNQVNVLQACATVLNAGTSSNAPPPGAPPGPPPPPANLGWDMAAANNNDIKVPDASPSAAPGAPPMGPQGPGQGPYGNSPSGDANNPPPPREPPPDRQTGGCFPQCREDNVNTLNPTTGVKFRINVQ